MVNESADFNTLKELLGVTDGNLASHTRALENDEYITVEKTFIGRKTNTRYKATAKGRQAFQEHLEALEKIIVVTSEKWKVKSDEWWVVLNFFIFLLWNTKRFLIMTND